MARIKKAQKGFTLYEAQRKRDSLDYDAKTRMQAARNRATRPGGSYDDIVKKLSEGARKSDSLKTVFDKAIQKAKSKSVPKQRSGGKTPAWTRSEGKDPKGGLNRKGIASYRRENPGSKLSMAVTTPPSKLKKGSKAANRRKSFCARMSGVKGPMKKPNGKPTRKALALRKWNC